MNICIILFDKFETLDVFGPVEIFGKLDNSVIQYYSLNGGLISNKDNISIVTKSIHDLYQAIDVLLIPGGEGTRIEIKNADLINLIKKLAGRSRYVLSVCTGSTLVAKAGLLDGKRATSNKRAFDWVRESSSQVQWIKQARWVVDGKYYTSSGISAGIDMALGFISDTYSLEKAEEIAFRIEYNWQNDADIDNFCNQ
ncbi:DJ-1/PfpI family protein [Dysgonomonas sp. ZJ279]|uniref:DJ-1/PfpI family protein n=1 Tax=Dysgonomonas sp. ZJ279 TaxID=2709796 RepID=UPI0013ED98DE|nr:DJ-1/PfpI family protein [Dysgonomonas sp. ZJ279]